MCKFSIKFDRSIGDLIFEIMIGIKDRQADHEPNNIELQL